MIQVSVRSATPGDWETIIDFNCRLAEESEGKILTRERVSRGVQALLQDSHKGRYFVACSETGQIIGQVMHTWEWSDWRNGHIWWLQSVYVAPDFRRKGVFRRLFDYVSAAARSDPGVVGLRLYVEAENHRGHLTYLNLGMQRSNYFVMEWMFSDEQPALSPPQSGI